MDVFRVNRNSDILRQYILQVIHCLCHNLSLPIDIVDNLQYGAGVTNGFDIWVNGWLSDHKPPHQYQPLWFALRE
jgi:hypothetical protein